MEICQPDLFTGLAPVAAPPLCEHRLALAPPCTFRVRGLDHQQLVEAKHWYEVGVTWREELESLDASRLFNRAVLAALLRVHGPLPKHCKAAARAGVERAVWEATGRRIRLRHRVKPLRVPVPLFLRGAFQCVFRTLL